MLRSPICASAYRLSISNPEGVLENSLIKGRLSTSSAGFQSASSRLGSGEIALGNGVKHFAIGFADTLGVQRVVFENAHESGGDKG